MGIKILIYFILINFMLTPYIFAFSKGKEEIVNYEKYGKFLNRGTPKYRYVIKNYRGLQKAVGPGIYPNFEGIKKEKEYIEAEIEGKLDGNYWDFVDRKRDYIINFFKWATVKTEPVGVRLFYVGYALEKAGLIKQAIKAYYALLVHFPKTISYTYWNTPLYLGRIAMDRIKLLLRTHPEIDWKYTGGVFEIKNIYDNNIGNDKYIAIDPGKLEKGREVKPDVDLRKLKVVETRGGSYVNLKKYSNGHWVLFVNDRPFFIKGLAYSPNQIGKSPDFGTLNVSRDWQIIDVNNNGINDVFFESYVDKNRNNKRDEDEPVVGDAKLLKEMGVNVLRLYHHCYNKKLFRKLYREYGIHIILGDFLGAYTIGSGAPWHQGTDYRDPVQRERMKASVKEMVEEYKDEPYVIMWVLGNENNFGNANNANKYPEVYYEFVNEVAKMIKKIDPTRPVAICNGDFQFLDIFAKKCPDVDVFGVNSYRGYLGFGDTLWGDVKKLADRPVLITEYGCPAYAKNMSLEEAEIEQMKYHKGNWEDIWYNRGGGPGYGNCIGGVIFEWADEWWKAGNTTDPYYHDTTPQFGGPFIDGWSYEEWFGLCSQGDGSDSPFLRVLRKSYFYYKKVWSNLKYLNEGGER